MKNLKQASLALLLVLAISISSCGGPNDDKGGMDQENSGGEGAIDSSRLTHIDTAHSSQSANADTGKH